MDLPEIAARIAAAGLAPRGALHLSDEECTGDLAGQRSLVLIGLAGQQGWHSYAASSEAQDGAPDPLDRFSRRVIGGLARDCGGTAFYPFGGPPHWPFQRWAQRAEVLHPSPLGLLIHPRYGLWHSYRGAIAFAEALALPELERTQSPCDACSAKPCRNTCPVGAFSQAGYAVDTCADWLRGAGSETCMQQGCLARRACPVGADFAHAPEQARFGMRAYLGAR